MIKPIAINLPQFHPFAENDEWWGKGFTEWTNVTKAKPLFKGHYQPHLPADLGFYDLRLEEARIAQAELARMYGIHGFCYYHYWFNGKRIMNRPLDDMLKTQTPDFPFMLCWANENWTKRWDGLDHEVLIKQDYSTEDDIEHIRFLLNTFFKDDRYIKVKGKPFFVIYRPALFPDIKQTIKTWRDEAAKSGTELYIGFMQSFAYKPDNFESLGFDCSIDFQPNLSSFAKKPKRKLKDRIKRRLGHPLPDFYSHRFASYPSYVDQMINSEFTYKANEFPGITPGWDNAARRTKGATIFTDSTPSDYSKWLKAIKGRYENKDTYLFINAWNEWAEGNHLEPDQKWGRQYLEQTAKILKDA
ncbi:glycoside hydrolase family 99-like domain-containing protein [Mucilaginibacter sp. PAMB04168]|uniref:glycosyltransferase WbsX family protein n=1 Tax=Mucilaginibacter sp. PAMB04168 TaxID=3138567 RepID=UPI0031F6399E